MTWPEDDDDGEAADAPVPGTATMLPLPLLLPAPVPLLPLPLCAEGDMSEGATPPMNESLPIATASGSDAAEDERDSWLEPLELELAAAAAGAT